MKLHEDKYAFRFLINQLSESSGIRQDILEKDYYVCLLLEELAKKQEKVPAYFKGGTALYKAQKSIRRFSEDIDITVNVDGCTNSQAKKRLETVTKKYVGLNRTRDKEKEEDRKGSITSVYDYLPSMPFDADDPLSRFGCVKIEGTSFTVSEPFTTLEIEPTIYTLASAEQKAILKNTYDIMPFELKTIKMERIFADKIFATEFYYERELYAEASKHLYDVSIMLETNEIQEMISDEGLLNKMFAYKRVEEEKRIGSDLAQREFKDFIIFKHIADTPKLAEAFKRMQDTYVFAETDKVSYDFVIEQWKKIEQIVTQL